MHICCDLSYKKVTAINVVKFEMKMANNIIVLDLLRYNSPIDDHVNDHVNSQCKSAVPTYSE